jgi:hypothetical protein
LRLWVGGARLQRHTKREQHTEAKSVSQPSRGALYFEVLPKIRTTQ